MFSTKKTVLSLNCHEKIPYGVIKEGKEKKSGKEKTS